MKIKHILTLTDEATGEEVEHDLPGKWEICDRCHGEGTTTEAVDGNGLDEEQTSDPEFMEDYMNGVYDQPCRYCEGGKAWVVDMDRLEPEIRKLLEQQQADAREIDHMYEMERRMGA